ncbi:class I mannose-6-phosphate isomerase [Nesterenkonia halophila]|uniref:class I mannose-6-phosphate isomerase n=1 Tax=Nesterenkonia halophila TaxID=302044 RepID=UPI00129095E6|nr:class I mannose-6-phosphate isomerase [Nesterenkonia halophila]
MRIPASAAARNYDKQPVIDVPGDHAAWSGPAAWSALAEHADGGTIVIDSYPGSDMPALLDAARTALPEAVVIDVEEDAALPPKEISALVDGDLTEDRVFGVMSHHRLEDFYDPARLRALAAQVSAAPRQHVLIGWGAALVPVGPATLVLADLARWEIQQRFRRGAGNWRADNGEEDALRKFKRGYFVEWRTADRHKLTLFDRLDFLLDTNGSVDEVKAVTGDAFRAGLDAVVSRPFRVVPFFDPGVWGGQWMKEVCGLDREAPNYAWCFDCVPEENSLLLGVGDEVLEVPALNAVISRPRELLGQRTFARFGAEFPIRFDFLDTVEGGNLSLQVHPLTEYIKQRFGMSYTQDESYYLLDATDDATVYLGLRDGIDPQEVEEELRLAETGETTFPAERFVNAFAARAHDHFAIPAGTVHASGAGSMVLEISATPYIFTFKMWDWGRVGLDGAPRPIHLDHALANVQWDRTTEWTRSQLVNPVEPLAEGPGWREERTGLHELEFIEVRRHWFTETVDHDTCGTVNVLNLVQGTEAVVESPGRAFAPFIVHYAETFIVPADVGAYRIRPLGEGEHATVKASVRGTARTGC